MASATDLRPLTSQNVLPLDHNSSAIDSMLRSSYTVPSPSSNTVLELTSEDLEHLGLDDESCELENFLYAEPTPLLEEKASHRPSQMDLVSEGFTQMLHDGCSPAELAEFVQQRGELDAEPDEEPFAVDSEAVLLDDEIFDDFQGEDENLLLQNLQATMQCQFRDRCNDSSCRKGAVTLRFLRTLIHTSRTRHSPKCSKLVIAIYQHSQYCGDLLCKVPYCFIFSKCEISNDYESIEWLELQIKQKQKESAGFSILQDKSQEDYFIKFDCPDKDFQPPVENVDFTVRLMGDFFDEALVLASRLPPCFCLLKKVPDFLSKKWYIETKDVLSKVSKDCPFIVEYVWLLYQPDYFVLCSRYCYETTLTKLLDSRVISPKLIKGTVLPKLVSALQFFKKKKIIYLSWISSSILVPCNVNGDEAFSQFSLAGFEASVVYDEKKVRGEEWREELRQRVPPFVAPPEVLTIDDDNVLTMNSDLYGIGALLVEMCTGRVLYHNYCHDENIISQISANMAVEADLRMVIDRELKEIIRSCLQLDPDQRRLINCE